MEKSEGPVPYGRQSISEADIEAVVDILRSDFLTQGPAVPRFEKAMAERVGAAYAVASNSATSSLHLACLALGVQAGDLVWTSPITFVASANCARYCGADVDFVDIDPHSFNMSVERLAEKLERGEAIGRLPKVVIPVHLAGHPADMRSIYELGQRYGFAIIEDASHAIGGRYRNTKIGSCAYSDITVFSFHPVKVITTGEGGMALTNNHQLARRISSLNSHGITREASEMTRAADGPWYYEQLHLGYNYRMTDIQAALGFSQLARLDDFVAQRHNVAKRYDQLLSDLRVVTPWRDEKDYSGFHLYVIKLRDMSAGDHKRVFEHLRSRGILVNLHYIPVYRQPDFARFRIDPADFPAAEGYYASAISLPLYPALTERDQDRVVEALREATAA